MRVKMITLACGPDGAFQPGDERDVSDDLGMRLVAGQHAQDITPRKYAEFQRIEDREPTRIEVEIAEFPEPERAVIRGKKGRGR